MRFHLRSVDKLQISNNEAQTTVFPRPVMYQAVATRLLVAANSNRRNDNTVSPRF